MISSKKKANIYGLVLIGGKSKRMKRDKSKINYSGKKQIDKCHDLLSKFCEKVYISNSVNNENIKNNYLNLFDIFIDSFGPLAGILTAMKTHNNVAWFVLACDMPFFDENAAYELTSSRDPDYDLTAFINNNGIAEPTSTIYEPNSFLPMLNEWAYGKKCPRKIIKKLNINKITPKNKKWLNNINTPEEQNNAKIELLRKINNEYRINYFASLREQRGCSSEIFKSQNILIGDLYSELKNKYNFTFKQSELRVSVNDSFVDWNKNINNGDSIIFLPPVAGG